MRERRGEERTWIDDAPAAQCTPGSPFASLQYSSLNCALCALTIFPTFPLASPPRHDHPRIPGIAEPRHAREQLVLLKVLREGEERDAQGGDEVDLLREPDARVVFDYAERLVHAAGEVEGVPLEEVGAEVVDCCYAVLDVL